MVDVSRSLEDLKNLFVDNSTGAISAQDLRDFLVSVMPVPNLCRFSAQTDIFSSSIVYPFSAAAIASGTLTAYRGSYGHPGVIQLNSSTNANSGYSYLINNTICFLFGGGEVGEVVFQTPSATSGSLSNTTIRAGYHDSVDYNDAVDGAYFELSGGVIVGKTATNSVRSTSNTSFTPTASTWYRMKLIVNNDATRVDFNIYDSSGTSLWTDYLTTNISTAYNREFSCGFVATNSATTAVPIALLDAMAFYSTKDAR